MGGKTSDSGRTLGDIARLEQKAKELLHEGASGRRNVFIGFAYEDADEVNLLRGQTRNKHSDIEFSDYSLKEPFDSKNAEYIRSKIIERIRQCSTTIIYLSNHTAKSRWVKWECEKSAELGKTVIAVHSGKTPPKSIPSFIRENKVKIVPWSDLARHLKKQ